MNDLVDAARRYADVFCEAVWLSSIGWRNSPSRISPAWIGADLLVATGMLLALVDDLQIMRAAIAPIEAQPPLVVDANAVNIRLVAI